ncbi:MAG: hypothetical protein AAB526_02420 [Patescibacteria group bacterium]
MIQPSVSLNEQIKKLLEENLEYSKEILKLNKKIYKYIFWKKVFDWIKTIIIVISIVWSIVFLPPMLKNFFDSYQELIRPFIGSQKIENINDLQKILTPTQIQEILKTIKQ